MRCRSCSWLSMSLKLGDVPSSGSGVEKKKLFAGMVSCIDVAVDDDRGVKVRGSSLYR